MCSIGGITLNLKPSLYKYIYVCICVYIYVYTERDAVEGALCGGPKRLDLELFTIITHKFPLQDIGDQN